MEAFEAAGVGVFALSYDEPEALADFGSAYGITYTLLSDPASEVIRSFGILNTLIDENDHPWFGIPFPGAYVVDAEGLITHKFFENNLAIRIGPEPLLRAARGEAADSPVADHSPPAETKWRIFVDGERLAIGVLRDLVVRIDVPAGRHLYADPAPEGNVPVTLNLDEAPGLVVRDVVKPASAALTLGGTGEVIQVYEGSVELRLPVTVNGDLIAVTKEPGEITLSGELRWQTCDDQMCDLPRREKFGIAVAIAGSVPSELNASADGVVVRGMNAPEHFDRMARRRTQSGTGDGG